MFWRTNKGGGGSDNGVMQGSFFIFIAGILPENDRGIHWRDPFVICWNYWSNPSAKIIIFSDKNKTTNITLSEYIFWLLWRHAFGHDSGRHGTSGYQTLGIWRSLHQEHLGTSGCYPGYHKRTNNWDQHLEKHPKILTLSEYIFWLLSKTYSPRRTFLVTNRVAMACHGLIFGQNEAHGFHYVF